MINLRRPSGRLRFIMRNPIPTKWRLFSECSPAGSLWISSTTSLNPQRLAACIRSRNLRNWRWNPKNTFFCILGEWHSRCYQSNVYQFSCVLCFIHPWEWMEIRTQNLELDAMHKFVRLNLCYVCHGRVIVIPFHLLMMKFRNGPKIGVEIICRTLNMWYPENTFMCRAIYQNKHKLCTLANKLKRNLRTLNHTEYNVSHLDEDGFRH